MFKGLFIGIGVGIGLLVGMAACTAALVTTGSIGDSLSQKFDNIAAELDEEESTNTSGQKRQGFTTVSKDQKASSLELKIESLKKGNFGTSDAIVRVDNKSTRSYSMIFVDCAFLGVGDQAIESGMAMITNLGAGQTGYGEATAMNSDAVKSIRCRISQTM